MKAHIVTWKIRPTTCSSFVISLPCSGTLLSRFLVASQPVRDLLLCAKHLFFAARVSVDGQSSLLVGSWSGAERRWIEGARSTEPGSLVRRRYSACPVDSCRNVYSVGQPAISPCGASAAQVCCAPLRSRNVSGRSCPGSDEQIFGADQQVPGGVLSD